MTNLFEKTLPKYYLFLLIIIFLFNNLQSQDRESFLKIKSNPTNHNSWWLEKNNYGKSIVDTEVQYTIEFKKNNTFYKLSISNAFENTNYLLDENNNFTIKEAGKKLLFGESYLKHNFSKNLFLRFGKYYRDFSLYLNDDISSGSMLVSKNAQPMPKIGIVGSYEVKKNNNVHFNYGLAHGFFKKNSFYSKRAPYLHEKFIYVNFEKSYHKFSFGLVHAAMWAGSTPKSGVLPRSLSDFFKIVIAADEADESASNINNPDYHQNSLGNHLGIWDFNYEKKNINNQKIKLYYQHIFEDTSGLRFANKTDGLWGLELVNYIKNTSLLFEYMDTSNAFADPPYQRDRYYWNYQYQQGWTYQGNIIGNPYVNTNFDSTRLIELKEVTEVFHFGVAGKLSSDINYTALASRRVNISDNINYKIVLIKKLNKSLNIDFSITNIKSKNGFSGGLTYIF